MKLGGKQEKILVGSGPIRHGNLKGLSFEESGHTGFQKAEEGKGLSTNDFTDARKAQLENLDGAYVFIGSYGSISEVELVVPDQRLKYTPVFNYLGEDVEFSQPYNFNPYVVKVLDQGVKEISSGVFKNYLSISQDEAIIFKVGMPVSIHVRDGESNSFTVNDTIHTIIFGNNVNINRTTADLILENTSSDIVGTTVTGIDCSPTVTIRTGDNVAVLHIAGRNFFEVLSHDYGEEIKELRKQISTGGGSVDLSGYATTEYVDNLIGDISAELDEVIAIQEEWINPVEAEVPVEPDNGEVEEI